MKEDKREKIWKLRNKINEEVIDYIYKNNPLKCEVISTLRKIYNMVVDKYPFDEKHKFYLLNFEPFLLNFHNYRLIYMFEVGDNNHLYFYKKIMKEENGLLYGITETYNINRKKKPIYINLLEEEMTEKEKRKYTKYLK